MMTCDNVLSSKSSSYDGVQHSTVSRRYKRVKGGDRVKKSGNFITRHPLEFIMSVKFIIYAAIYVILVSRLCG